MATQKAKKKILDKQTKAGAPLGATPVRTAREAKPKQGAIRQSRMTGDGAVTRSVGGQR